MTPSYDTVAVTMRFRDYRRLKRELIDAGVSKAVVEEVRGEIHVAEPRAHALENPRDCAPYPHLA